MSTDGSTTDSTIVRTATLAEGGSFLLMLAALFSCIVAGIGVLGAVSAMYLEDGGALFLSVAAITVGAIGFSISLKRHLATGVADSPSAED